MTNLTMYELAHELAATLDQIDPETGELPAGFAEVRGLVERKGAAVAAYIAQRELEAEAFRSRLKEAQERVRKAEQRITHLRRYLADCMRTAGVTKIDSQDAMLSVRLWPERDESVDVYDETLLRDDLCSIKVTRTPDKTAIKRAITEGQDVQGARIVRRDRLEIK
jgi:hypothetical protein